MSRSNCTMPIKKIAGFTAYFFAYNATPDMRFKFSMLCEVGRPWIPVFERIIKSRNLDLVTVEIPEKPYVITVRRQDTTDYEFHCPNCNAQYDSVAKWWREVCNNCGYRYPRNKTKPAAKAQHKKKGK